MADDMDADDDVFSTAMPSAKLSIGDIFRDDLGKERQAPSWMSTTLFPLPTLDKSPPPTILEPDEKSKLELDDDESSTSSDDGLGNTPEYLSGRYVPSSSIARFGALLPRSSLSPIHPKDNDSDDEDDEDPGVPEVCPSAVEIPVDWGNTTEIAETPVAPPPPPPAASVSVVDIVQPEETAAEVLRKSVVALIDVQSRYLKALRLVERSYINVVRASNVLRRKPRLLSDAEIAAVFVNWRDLVTIATELKRALRQCRQSAGENDAAALGSILNMIAGHIASYSRIYIIFVAEFTHSTKSLEQVNRHREAFAELVELNEACDKTALATLMAAPFTYMSEMRDALRRLNRSLEPCLSNTTVLTTPKSGLEVLSARTYAAVIKLDDEIGREKTLSEARSRVGQVQEFLFDGKVNLVAPGRYCIRYGALLKLTNANKKDGKLLTFFLFNDLFLGADGKAGQMRVKYALDLHDLNVAQTGSASFHIESSVKSLLLSSSNETNARAWIQDIQEHSATLRQTRGTAPPLDPMALDALIRDETKRIDSTIAISVCESHDLLSSKKEYTMPEPAASVLHVQTAGNLTMNEDEGTAPLDSLAMTSPSQASSTFKIYLTAAQDETGVGMQGYLKLKGTTFSSLSSMFFVVNVSKQELHSWKLKADAAKSVPKKSITLKDSVTFASDFPEGAGIELIPADSRRVYVLIAPDATIRDAWCAELAKYHPADRVCEDFLEKRGGNDGQKPWRSRYFVLCRTSRSIIYFHKRQDSGGLDWQLNANGSIDIAGCSVRQIDCNEATQTLDRKHVLELTPKTMERHFFLASKHEVILMRWLGDIKRLSVP